MLLEVSDWNCFFNFCPDTFFFWFCISKYVNIKNSIFWAKLQIQTSRQSIYNTMTLYLIPWTCMKVDRSLLSSSLVLVRFFFFLFGLGKTAAHCLRFLWVDLHSSHCSHHIWKISMHSGSSKHTNTVAAQ